MHFEFGKGNSQSTKALFLMVLFACHRQIWLEGFVLSYVTDPIPSTQKNETTEQKAMAVDVTSRLLHTCAIVFNIASRVAFSQAVCIGLFNPALE